MTLKLTTATAQKAHRTPPENARVSPVGDRVGGDDGSSHSPGAGTVAPRTQAARLPLG